MSGTNRYGGQYGDWAHLASPLSAAPTVANQTLTPPYGETLELVARMPGGVTSVDIVIYRFVTVNGVDVIPLVQTTTLTGHASEVRHHFVSCVHRNDRVAVALLNQSGAGTVTVGYRWA
jgi:hypothetical protein